MQVPCFVVSTFVLAVIAMGTGIKGQRKADVHALNPWLRSNLLGHPILMTAASCAQSPCQH